MHNNIECQGTGVEHRDAGVASLLANHNEPSAFDVQSFAAPKQREGGSTFDVSPAPPFDEFKATQARADLIAFTKTFFGLDDDCALPVDI